MMELTIKDKAIQFIKSLELLDATRVKFVDQQNFLEHDIASNDGIIGLIEALKTDDSGLQIHIARVFQDGEYVFLHSEYVADTSMIAFDLLRFSDGLAVEHWSNFQFKEEPNPSGRTMLDGISAIDGYSHTDITKGLARDIVNDVLVHGRLDKLPAYFDDDHYIQHNPWFADKVSGLITALTKWAEQGTTMTYSKIHKVLGEANFALVISEGELRGNPSSFYDLFRVENGKIIEHWDTIEAIPAGDAKINPLEKFGFEETKAHQLS